MAAKAFVLIETAVGTTRDVVSKLRQIEGVKSAEPVTGPYDVIAVVEGESLSEIGDLVTGEVQALSGLSRTVACLAI